MTGRNLPYFVKGEVVKGFGRGSRELGCPTANFPEDVVNCLPEDFATGVYCGYAQVDGGEVHKMVMSVGWNPFYNNTKKSIETHVMHKFESDFYGKELKIVVLEYLRAMKNFGSLDELIKAIETDISDAKSVLEQTNNLAYKSNEFFA
ncbi:riboflavin kinase [Rhynchophorus ferrugineus]|uniref:Riboflavin kinase n=1 Tax=Rhynchophorus ferrugineus TaxID=354439 RepID=A0A834HIB5_RHYFE|nr:hypothetical protein GWI33_003932 [Rhynchophorus ferrugineus]KAF7262899.1 hypothetical protein GWI33_003926 [Rhynchophorus ferrugineus]